MSNDPVSILISTARQLLKSTPNASVDLVAIGRIIQAAVPVVQATSGVVFSESEIEAAKRALEAVYVVEQGPALALVDAKRPPDWYVGDRRRPSQFMERYLQKLEEDNWPVESVDELRESTARVLQFLDDPERPGPWDWRGLVVGDVQSGKTANYTGVVNRAADAGYRIIVVLAGMHSILRLQTQKRLDDDFLGYDTNPRSAVGGGPRKVIGVGQLNPTLIVDSLTVALPGGDFRQAVADQANFAPLSQPCLLVVKKNAKVLENLNGWIGRLPAASRVAPLLVIDDEADQASVDTGDQAILSDGSFDPDYDPKTINGEIRKLLKSFARSAYVAYTATPFANILIHDERTSDNFGRDLFPSTFIVSLTPPDDYFGPIAVFGTVDDDDLDGLPVIRDVDQTREAWIPDRHDKALVPRYNGKEEIPPSLAKAIDSFVLTCSTRAARGQTTAHNSMLVHVSRYVDVHKHVHTQVDRHLRTIQALISGGDRQTIERLKQLWDADFVETSAQVKRTQFGRLTPDVSWSEVLAALPDAAEKIGVIVANGSSKTDIDYDSYKKTGRSLIAVGGDKLARGLTLEGLSVSYFLRISKQYDSLLQMGRWFGYRRGYADLCRLYTTSDMEDWFTHVATATRDLRTEIAHMQITGATPKDYGLRVEGHSILNVTASGKQRHAVERLVSYAGEGKIQTLMLSGKSIVEQNADVTDRFIASLASGEQSPRRPGQSSRASGELWRDVSGGDVATFLSDLQFPADSPQLNGARMAQYIRRQLGVGELTNWTVFLPSADSKPVTLGGRTLNSVKRKPREDRSTPGLYIVRTILSPLDESIDLTDDEFRAALALTNAERAAEGELPTDRPNGPNVRKVRGERPQNGLLVIYPLDPDIGLGPRVTERPVIGVVVSFPDSPTARRQTFVENLVKTREEPS